MTTSAQTEQLLQEFFILATGTAANTRDMQDLLPLVGADGNMEQIYQLIDSFMFERAAPLGTVGMVQAIAKHGLGMVLSTAEADVIVQDSMNAGINTWSKLFAFLASNEAEAGQILDNRGEAATYFTAQLEAAGKIDLNAGGSINAAVTTLLQNIGASVTSLDNAKQGLGVLTTNLTADGIISAVVDGYVRGATVFADANGNGALDAGEWSTTTDVSGNYVLAAEVSAGTIIAYGGIDIMTNNAFQGVLTAPAGSTVINPLTTLVQTLLQSGESATVQQATDAVQSALGLPANINLLSYDPLAVLASATATDAAKATALGVQAIALQVANIITQGANAIDAAASTGTGTLQSSAAALTSALATALNEATGVMNLSSATTLTAVIQEASTQSVLSTGGTALTPAQIGQIAQITSSSNTGAAAATNITELSKAAVVSQGSATDAIISGTTGGSLTAAVNAFTGTSLDNAVNAAVPALIATDVPVPVSPAPAPTPAPVPAPTFSVTKDGSNNLVFNNKTGSVVLTVESDKLVFQDNGGAGTKYVTTYAVADIANGGMPAVTLNATTFSTAGLAAKLAAASATVTGVTAANVAAVLDTTGVVAVQADAGNAADALSLAYADLAKVTGFTSVTVTGVTAANVAAALVTTGVVSVQADTGDAGTALSLAYADSAKVTGFTNVTVTGVTAMNVAAALVTAGVVAVHADTGNAGAIVSLAYADLAKVTGFTNVTVTGVTAANVAAALGKAGVVSVLAAAGQEALPVTVDFADWNKLSGFTALTLTASGVDVTTAASHPHVVGVRATAGQEASPVTVAFAGLAKLSGFTSVTVTGVTPQNAIGAADTTGVVSVQGTGSVDIQLDNYDAIKVAKLSGYNSITINGTALSDTIDATGISSALTIIGSAGDDNITGGSGNDIIKGGSGNNIINGGSGDDVITGGGNRDDMTGGLGNDKFVFANQDRNTTGGAVTDIIGDFVSGTDTIGGSFGAGSGANVLEAGAVAADLTALLTAADNALNGTVKYYIGQVDGGDLYVVTDDNGIGYTEVIQLVGQTLATFDGAISIVA